MAHEHQNQPARWSLSFVTWFIVLERIPGRSCKSQELSRSLEVHNTNNRCCKNLESDLYIVANASTVVKWCRRIEEGCFCPPHLGGLNDTGDSFCNHPPKCAWNYRWKGVWGKYVGARGLIPYQGGLAGRLYSKRFLAEWRMEVE
jgi:hypothetical protein